MAIVYKIVENATGKIYIGVTKKDIGERLQQHFQEAHKPNRNHRKLYKAINKIGEHGFSIEKIEECSDNERFEREKKWIEYHDSFRNGYNDTYGGKGRHQRDYTVIAETYRKLNNIKQTASLLGVDALTVKNALVSCDIPIVPNAEVVRSRLGKGVKMFDMNGQYQRSFATLREAAESVSVRCNKDLDGVAAHIGAACSGKRKSAYRHKWAFTNTGV